MKWLIPLCLWLSCLAPGCNHSGQTMDQSAPDWAGLPQRCNERLTEVIVYDIISPPVASRIYAYSNIAFYEALRPAYASAGSLLPALKGFDTLNVPGNPEGIHFPLSAVMAFMKVAHTLIFSKDSMAAAEKKLIREFGNISSATTKRSKQWADQVAAVILRRAALDNYKKTRGMARYSVFGEKGQWQQTPPEYADATEPHWRLIRPLLMDSASAYRPVPPQEFDMSKNSAFFQEVMEVYRKSKRITPAEDTIARFWDDNPFVTEHRGHLTYANKKMTPVGHWMGITGILCGITQKDARICALAYALSSAAIFDGFISCWDEKYRSRRIRPVTVIREYIESEWEPLLQTPSFPEYTSGHSVISASASTTLEYIFGKAVAFTDSTEWKYLGITRSFPSIRAASDEAGISRLYGGIHFSSAITYGKIQGVAIAKPYCQLFDNVSQ